MKKWLHYPYRASTFNDCHHQNWAASPAHDDADELSVAAASCVESVRAITWERFRAETEKDTTMLQLIAMVQLCLPPNRSEMPPNTADYTDSP